MFEIAFLPKLMAVHMTATASPGPNFAIVSKVASEDQNWRSSIGVALGVTLGISIHASVALLGVSKWIITFPIFAMILKGLASLFLGYLGFLSAKGLWCILRERISGAGTQSPSETAPRERSFYMGFGTCIVNPKAFFYFATVLPQTFDKELSPFQLALALIVIPILTFLWFALV